MLSDGSGTRFAAGMARSVPRPLHSPHDPAGELKENRRGSGSTKLLPQPGHDDRRLYSVCWPSRQTATEPSASPDARSREARRRLRMPGLLISPSMTTAMSWR